MNCSEFNSNIKSFNDGSIDDDILEEYINHYKSCSQCREELEIYYLIHKVFDGDLEQENKGMQDLNLKLSLENDIKSKEDMIYKEYKQKFLFSLAFWTGNVTAIITAMYFIFYIFL